MDRDSDPLPQTSLPKCDWGTKDELEPLLKSLSSVLGTVFIRTPVQFSKEGGQPL